MSVVTSGTVLSRCRGGCCRGGGCGGREAAQDVGDSLVNARDSVPQLGKTTASRYRRVLNATIGLEPSTDNTVGLFLWSKAGFWRNKNTLASISYSRHILTNKLLPVVWKNPKPLIDCDTLSGSMEIHLCKGETNKKRLIFAKKKNENLYFILTDRN